MKVGLLTVSFRLHAVSTLKEKRSIVKRMLADIHRCGPSFAACEINHHEDLRRLTLRVAHLSNDPRYTDSELTRLQRRLERKGRYDVTETRSELL
jgi:uncharacterized protein YlxP (DUF503 family)